MLTRISTILLYVLVLLAPTPLYANPHAVTSIGGTATSTYDNNGNMLTYKAVGVATSTYTWDYRNRMTQSLVAGNATSYGYDINDERVLSGSTIYPFTLYNTQGSTSTIAKHIFANGQSIADIQGSGATASVYYLHNDNLNGTNVVGNSSSNVDQLYAYYPYGSQRVAEKNGSFTEQRQYIGQEYDAATALNYLNARYYNSSQGQFLSEDPTHLAIGDPGRVKGVTGLSQQAVLSEPQLFNSYSYAKNNPIRYKDPEGKFVPQAIALGALYGGVSSVAFQAYSDYQTGNQFNLSTYASSFGKGATVGATTVYGAIPAAVASIGYSLTSNYFGGGVTMDNTINAFTEGAVTGLTAGFLKGLPGVPGPQASKVFGGYYFGGAHGVRYTQEAAFGLGTSVYFNNVQGITNQFTQPTTQQSASLNSSLSVALSGVVGAFTPSNSQQAAVVQRVISAFSQKRRRKQYSDSNNDEVDDPEPSWKYTTNWKGTIIIFAALAIFNAVIFYLNRNPEMPPSKVIIGLIAWFTFVGLGVLLMTVYSYASISGTTLKFVWLLFSHRTIDINSITDINDQPTNKVARSQFRSLYVFYKDKSGETKWIEFRITIFPEKTLGRLIRDLKEINPQIKLNIYSQKLMDSTS